MKKLIILSVVAGFLFFAGKVYANQARRVTTNTKIESGYVTSNNENSTQNKRGAEIYNRKCFSCHQTTGMGLPGVFPPLKGSDFLKSASKKRLIEQVMNGSKEQLTVNGMTYSTPMPPQVDNVQDAVAVINYVLNSWGNDYGKVTAEDVKDIKPSKSGSK